MCVGMYVCIYMIYTCVCVYRFGELSVLLCAVGTWRVCVCQAWHAYNRFT